MQIPNILCDLCGTHLIVNRRGFLEGGYPVWTECARPALVWNPLTNRAECARGHLCNHCVQGIVASYAALPEEAKVE